MSGVGTRWSVAVLISGRGSNMAALARRAAQPDSPYRVAKVFADNPAAAGLGLAADLGIDTQALRPADFADRAAYDSALADAVESCAPALVVLAGFMRVLSAPFLLRFPAGILNIHPSLLPKYPGLHTHRRVLAARERTHGATVHFVTAELDGGPAVIQGRLETRTDDDETGLAGRVSQLEHRMYPLAVRWFCEGRLALRDGLAWFDGKPLREPLQLDAVENT